MVQKLNLKSRSLDIETAFLNGALTEEICMKVPDRFDRIHGEEKAKNKVLRLNNQSMDWFKLQDNGTQNSRKRSSSWDLKGTMLSNVYSQNSKVTNF
jgi:phosphoketolase